MKSSNYEGPYEEEPHEWDNKTPEEIQKEFQKIPGYDDKYKSAICFNDAIVLLKSFPKQNLHKGNLCVFEGFAKAENGEIEYFITFHSKKIDEIIMGSVPPSACIKIID